MIAITREQMVSFKVYEECMTFGCMMDTVARGLCMICYCRKRNLIHAGIETWKSIEDLGQSKKKKICNKAKFIERMYGIISTMNSNDIYPSMANVSMMMRGSRGGLSPKQREIRSQIMDELNIPKWDGPVDSEIHVERK